MTDVIEQRPEVDAVEQQPEIDVQAVLKELEETKKKLETVAAHKDKLYQETKAAKAEREAAKAEAERISQEKALKDGEYEKLWQKASQEKETLAKQIEEIRTANRNEKIQNSALLISNRLAEGDNVEILSEFVQRSLVNLADETGALSADVIDAVTKEFEQNSKFKSLLKGIKSVGGSAPGNTRSTPNTKTVDRETFDKMSHYERTQFFQKGGSIN